MTALVSQRYWRRQPLLLEKAAPSTLRRTIEVTGLRSVSLDIFRQAPLGFLLSAYVAATLFPNSQGSGIPQATASRHLRYAEDRARLLSLKIALGKIILTVFGLFSGASISREGPTVQVGASIMLAVARFGGKAQTRGLILAGSAAGIAAINTPLAGIVFAIEEMSRTAESRANGLVLTAVILSGLAALGLSGSYNYSAWRLPRRR
ncbi:voltage-gated chloride channel [Rhizobium sullae]|uniref:Voltage-gated chloride channel n=1 Tax=Rhizobium sullae TaxID=50338 RepID=A0A4R3PTK4_RHISU|nr:voltage-gated chloride channel [Rhizobium sullae]